MTDSTPTPASGNHIAADGRIRQNGSTLFGFKEQPAGAPVDPTPYAGTPISIAEGDTWELADDSRVYDNATVIREDDTWVISAEQTVDLTWFAPTGPKKQDWVDRNYRVINDFIQKRYSLFHNGTDDDGRDIYGTNVTYDGDTLTETEAFNLLGTETNLTQLFNESDDGTNGTENLSRLLRNHVENQVVAVTADIDDEPELDDAEINRILSADALLTDNQAIVVAKKIRDAGEKLTSSTQYTAHLHQLVQNGYTDKQALVKDLQRLGAFPDVDAYWASALWIWTTKP